MNARLLSLLVLLSLLLQSAPVLAFQAGPAPKTAVPGFSLTRSFPLNFRDPSGLLPDPCPAVPSSVRAKLLQKITQTLMQQGALYGTAAASAEWILASQVAKTAVAGMINPAAGAIMAGLTVGELANAAISAYEGSVGGGQVPRILSNPELAGAWGSAGGRDPIQNLAQHYNKHGSDMGFSSVEQYAKAAERFRTDVLSRELTGRPMQIKDATGRVESWGQVIQSGGRQIFLDQAGNIVSFH